MFIFQIIKIEFLEKNEVFLIYAILILHIVKMAITI